MIEFVKGARRKGVIGEEPIAHAGRAGLAELVPELERQRRRDRNGARDVLVVWDCNGASWMRQDALDHIVGVIVAKVIDDYRERLRLPSQGILRKLPQIEPDSKRQSRQNNYKQRDADREVARQPMRNAGKR